MKARSCDMTYFGRTNEVAMQRARDPESKGADPVRVFVILAAVLVAIGAFFLFTRTDPTSDSEASPASSTPDFSLTDEEAITRAQRLEKLVLNAYRTRDVSLLSEIYASDSPLLRKARNEISYLQRRGVTSETHYRLLEMSVVENGSREIVLRERAEFDVRFFDEDGNDVTKTGRPELQTTQLTLHRELDEWLIFDSVIVDAEPLR